MAVNIAADCLLLKKPFPPILLMQLSLFDESDESSKAQAPELLTAEYLDRTFCVTAKNKWSPAIMRRWKHFDAIGDVLTRDAIILEYKFVE